MNAPELLTPRQRWALRTEEDRAVIDFLADHNFCCVTWETMTDHDAIDADIFLRIARGEEASE